MYITAEVCNLRILAVILLYKICLSLRHISFGKERKNMSNSTTSGAKKSGIKLSYIIGLILYFLVCHFIIQFTGYTELYPRKNIGEVFDITVENLTQDPFAFIIPNASGWSGIIIFSLVFLLIVAYIWTINKKDEHEKKDVNGSAKWIKDEELPNKWDKRYSDPKNEPVHDGQKNMIITQNIYISMDTRQTRRNNNVLVIGGSGAGKSRFFVKPNLCEMPLNCNFVCTDPSGELLADMGTLLEDAGFKIKVFNLVDMKKSDRYNPMNYIHSEIDVILLVDCILANTTDPNKKGGDDFWEKAQKLMLQAFIFLVWKHGKELHLPLTLSSILFLMDNCQINESSSSDDMNLTDKYFAAVKEQGWWFDRHNKFHLGTPSENEKDDVVEQYEKVGTDICDKQYTKFKMGAGKTLKSILISAMARLSTLDSKDVADLLSHDEIEFNKLGDEKSALFVIIPQEHESFNFLAAMLYTQLFQSLYYHAENECRGNYIVIDSNGEIVKIFEIPHTQENEEFEDESNLKEIEVDFSKEIQKESDIKKKSKRKLSLLKKSYDIPKQNTKNNVKNETDIEKILDENVEHSAYVNEAKYDNEDELNNAFNEAIENNNFMQQHQIDEDFKEENEYENEVTNDKTTQIKISAERFCIRAKEKAHCVKKGKYYYIKVPGESSNDPEDIIGKYLSADFAKEKMKAIKNGCKVTICGLHLPYHVRFLLDEFANIGQIPDFTKKLATMRKYEISSTVILQNLAQIKNIYKDDWGSIMGNCDSFLFLGCPELDTLEYVSKMLGKKTIIVRDHSTSKGGRGSSNLSYKYQGRELATADELRRMKDDECIFILRGEQPYRGLKHKYTNHKNYKYTADADKENTYHFKKNRNGEIQTTYQSSESELSLNNASSEYKGDDIADSKMFSSEFNNSDLTQYRNESVIKNSLEIYNTAPTVNDISVGKALYFSVDNGIIDEKMAKEILSEINNDIINAEFNSLTNKDKVDSASANTIDNTFKRFSDSNSA